jgi:hypothetical protein
MGFRSSGRPNPGFGLKVLKNSPGFTVVVVLTLALGIAMNSTVFSWIDGCCCTLFRASITCGIWH